MVCVCVCLVQGNLTRNLYDDSSQKIVLKWGYHFEIEKKQLQWITTPFCRFFSWDWMHIARPLYHMHTFCTHRICRTYAPLAICILSEGSIFFFAFNFESRTRKPNKCMLRVRKSFLVPLFFCLFSFSPFAHNSMAAPASVRVQFLFFAFACLLLQFLLQRMLLHNFQCDSNRRISRQNQLFPTWNGNGTESSWFHCSSNTWMPWIGWCFGGERIFSNCYFSNRSYILWGIGRCPCACRLHE